MQVVGKTCVGCGHRIRAAQGATGCLDCDIAFHHGCVDAARQRLMQDYRGAPPESDRCPECGGDYTAAWAEKERADEEERERGARENERLVRRRRTGATLVMIGIGGGFVAPWRLGLHSHYPTVAAVFWGLGALALIAGAIMVATGRDRAP